MCFNQTGDIFTLDGTSLKLVDKFTYLGSSVSSTEKDIDTRLTKAWTAIDKLSIMWKSDLTDKMKRSFFQAAVVSILLYGYTTWTLTKRLEFELAYYDTAVQRFNHYTIRTHLSIRTEWNQILTFFLVSHSWLWNLSIDKRKKDPLPKFIFIRTSHRAGFDTRSFYSGDLGEEEVGHEPKVMTCLSMLVIGSLVAKWIMLAFAKSPDTYARWHCWSQTHERTAFKFWIDSKFNCQKSWSNSSSPPTTHKHLISDKH